MRRLALQESLGVEIDPRALPLPGLRRATVDRRGEGWNRNLCGASLEMDAPA